MNETQSATHPVSPSARRQPNLFLIGASKAGTTSLYEYIEGHPDIYMSRVKEPQYFSPDLPDPLERYPYGEGLERYLALFDGATTERWRGEASSYYLFSRQAPHLIHEFDPEARIVAALRNPVDAVYSLHGHLTAYGHEHVTDFDEALADEEGDLISSEERRLKIQRHGTYLARGRYAEQLAPWFELFGPEQRLIIVFEDLAADAAGQLKRLLEFLDVDPDYQPASLDARNRSHRVRRRPMSLKRSVAARWLRRAVVPHVIGEESASQIGRSFKRSRFAREEVQRPPLSAAARERLEEAFAPDIEALSEMLDRDLLMTWLGRPSQPSLGASSSPGIRHTSEVATPR